MVPMKACRSLHSGLTKISQLMVRGDEESDSIPTQLIMAVGDVHKMVSRYDMKIKEELIYGLTLQVSVHDMNGLPVIYTM